MCQILFVTQNSLNDSVIDWLTKYLWKKIIIKLLFLTLMLFHPGKTSYQKSCSWKHQVNYSAFWLYFLRKQIERGQFCFCFISQKTANTSNLDTNDNVCSLVRAISFNHCEPWCKNFTLKLLNQYASTLHECLS